MLRPENVEKIDVIEAIDDLVRCSFIEINDTTSDEDAFVSVPFVTAEFGKKKIKTSPMKSAIEGDLALLHLFGPTNEVDITKGVTPRIQRLVKNISGIVSQDKGSIEDYEKLIEFIARKAPDTWLLLGRLHKENGEYLKSIQANFHFIEAVNGAYEGLNVIWRQIADMYRTLDDIPGESHALIELIQIENIDFTEISSAANRFNELSKNNKNIYDSEAKRIISSKLASIMSMRISEGDATDCSRLAWLFMNLGDSSQARIIIDQGLSLDPNNIYCLNLNTQLENELASRI